jgi:hypothetical protein
MTTPGIGVPLPPPEGVRGRLGAARRRPRGMTTPGSGIPLPYDEWSDT